MEILVFVLLIVILILTAILDKKNRKIAILENNWETAKIVIGNFDPSFKKYLEENSQVSIKIEKGSKKK